MNCSISIRVSVFPSQALEPRALLWRLDTIRTSLSTTGIRRFMTTSFRCAAGTPAGSCTKADWAQVRHKRAAHDWLRRLIQLCPRPVWKPRRRSNTWSRGIRSASNKACILICILALHSSMFIACFGGKQSFWFVVFVCRAAQFGQDFVIIYEYGYNIIIIIQIIIIMLLFYF